MYIYIAKRIKMKVQCN